MEEQNTTAYTPETAPQESEAQSATEEQSASDVQSATSEQAGTEEAGQNSENIEATNGEQNETADSGVDSAPFLSLRYNHELRELSQSETVDYVQKGIHSEPIVSELRYLAAQNGSKSVKEFLDYLKNNAENARRENIRGQLADESNEELLDSIFAAETEKMRAEAGAIEQNEQKEFSEAFENENARIADEFLALKAEFPEMNEFKDVPQQVIQLSAKKNISLLDAYLRFQHEENKKIKEAEQTAAKAKESTVGSAVSEDHDSSSPLIEAMRNGVWR